MAKTLAEIQADDWVAAIYVDDTENNPPSLLNVTATSRTVIHHRAFAFDRESGQCIGRGYGETGLLGIRAATDVELGALAKTGLNGYRDAVGMKLDIGINSDRSTDLDPSESAKVETDAQPGE